MVEILFGELRLNIVNENYSIKEHARGKLLKIFVETISNRHLNFPSTIYFSEIPIDSLNKSRLNMLSIATT